MANLTKPVKVMRIITRLNIGGPAINAVLLSEGLNGNGFETRLVTGMTSQAEGDMSYVAKGHNIQLTVIPELGREIRLLSDMVALWKLLQILRKEKPDIVHTHTAKAGALGRCAALLSGAPIKVHTFHGHVFENYFNPIKAKMFIFMERIFAKFTDRVIVVSDRLKRDICDNFNIASSAKTSVIRLGLELEKFKYADRTKGSIRKELKIDDKILLIGIVGRLTAIKNHKLFLETARGLLRSDFVGARNDEGGLPFGVRCSNVRFVVVGDGELRSEIKNSIKEMGMEGAFLFTGWRQDMPEVYADLDIVTLTSLNEGTPLSLIEAMAAKRPVVATAVGGVPDLVKDGETGLLVESNNAAQLKEAILKLLKDETLRRRLGEKASNYVCATYSKERLIKDMENLYKELIGIKKDKKGLKRINKGE